MNLQEFEKLTKNCISDLCMIPDAFSPQIRFVDYLDAFEVTLSYNKEGLLIRRTRFYDRYSIDQIKDPALFMRRYLKQDMIALLDFEKSNQ